MCPNRAYVTFFRLLALVSLLTTLFCDVIGTKPTYSVTPSVSPVDINSYDNFGASCSISGDYLIVGAPKARYNPVTLTNTGTAYIYSRSSGEFLQSARLTSGTTYSGSWFGQSVAISGDVVVVGAPYDNHNQGGVWKYDCGAAYVYARTPGTEAWPLLTALRDPKFMGDRFFGFSVAIDGDTIVIGAPYDNTLSGFGAADVFCFEAGAWAYSTTLTTPAAVKMGFSVAISGDTIVVGAPSTTNEALDFVGRAYVYKGNGASWVLQATLRGDDWKDDMFGHSVAISGDTIVVGAKDHGRTTSTDYTGSAFVFERSGAAWTRTTTLRPDAYVTNVQFGYSVAIDDKTIVVTAPYTNTAELYDTGKMYVFHKTGSSWIMATDLIDGDSQDYDKLGTAVCVNGDTVVAGARYADPQGYESGSMTLFRSDCPITQGTYMKPFFECNIPADSGYHVPNDGKLWPTQLPCNGGWWQNLGGQTTCNACPADTVTPTPGGYSAEAYCKAPFPASVTLGRTTALTTFAAPDSATMDGAPCRVVPGTKVGELSLIVPVVDAMIPGTHTVNATFNADLGIQETVDIYIPPGATYSTSTAYTLNGKDVTFQTKYPVCFTSTSTYTSGSTATLTNVARDGDMAVCVHRATMFVDDIIAKFSPALAGSPYVPNVNSNTMICIEYGAEHTEFSTVEGIEIYVNGTALDRYAVDAGRVCASIAPILSDAFEEDVVVATWEVRATLFGTTILTNLVYDTNEEFSLALFVERAEHWTVVALIAGFIIAAPALPCTLLATVLVIVTTPCTLCASCFGSYVFTVFAMMEGDEHKKKKPDDVVIDLPTAMILAPFGAIFVDAIFRSVYLAAVLNALVCLVPICWVALISSFVCTIAMFVGVVGVGFAVLLWLIHHNITTFIRIRAERRAIAALTDDVYVRASEINARMENHPHLQPNLMDPAIPASIDIMEISVHLAELYCNRRDAVQFEEKLGIKTMKDEDALPTMAAHCKKLMDAHPFVAHKVEAATGHVQKAGLSPFRREIFSMTDAATPITAVRLMNNFEIKDTKELILHPMAKRFIVRESSEYTKLDTVKRATVVASRAECFEVTGDFNPQEEWAALMQVIGRHTQVMPVFERTNLAHIVRTWDVVAKWAAVDQDELIPRAAKAWTTDTVMLVLTNPTWKLNNRPQFSAHVAALQSLVGHIQLFAGEDILEEEVVATLRITATAAVQDEALLLSMPADHEEEMSRIKKAIKRGKRAIYHAENPESDEETEDPAVVRAQLRQLGREREQLMAGLAHLNGAGFVDAPVLPPLENRCEDTMTLAMFENVRPLAQSNATILAAQYNGEAVVLKQYSGGDKKARKKMYNELRTLESIRHPNVAQIKYAFPDQRMFYLVFDHYKFGDLLDWANDTNPTEGDVLYAAKKTIEAVACLHGHDIIHCDIKPANVFVTATGNPMLGDFDVSKSADGRTMTATVAGSLAYMAPELYTKSETGEQPRMSTVTDVFSLGRTLSQLVAGRTDLLDGVIKRMTAKEPADRPTLVEVLQETAFTDAERGRVEGIADELADLKKRQDELARREQTMSAQVKQVTDVMWARHEELAAEARRIEHLKEERLCMICKERLAVHAYSKCGHVSVCAVCAQPKRCPRCNKKSTKVCYAFKGALSKVNASSFAMMGTAERAEVVRAFVLEYGMVDTVMTLYELLQDYPHLPFHKMDDELMLETLRYMKARGMAVLIQCGDGTGVKFPYGSL